MIAVEPFRLGGRAAAVASLVFALAAAPAGTNLTLPAGDSPVVRISMRDGSLSIYTWSRPQVRILSNDIVESRTFPPPVVARALHGDMPIFSSVVRTPNGLLVLPAEGFPLGSLPPEGHQGIFVRANSGDVHVAVPSGTALVIASVGRGRIRLQNYRNGTFVARVHNGVIALRNVAGSGYVEAARGRVQALRSSFDRLRARTAIGDLVFNNCDSREIEVSSIDGSIAYDNGSFRPGLARFASQNGAIVLGVSGSVQIGAHSSSGQIFSDFAGHADLRGNGSDTRVAIGSNGPIVTASSGAAIYLYDGSLAQHRNLGGAWRGVRFALPRPRARSRP